MRARKRFVPTRECPHRWCRFTHRWYRSMGTVVVIAMFVANPIAEAVVFMFGLCVAAALMTSRFGPGIQGRVAHQTAGAGGSTSRTEVAVDHRWARVAAGCDVIFCAATVVDLAAIGVIRSRAYQQSHGIPPTLGWAMIGGAAIVLFTSYAHWRATRPRPPRRVRVWIRARVPALVTGR